MLTDRQTWLAGHRDDWSFLPLSSKMVIRFCLLLHKVGVYAADLPTTVTVRSPGSSVPRARISVRPCAVDLYTVREILVERVYAHVLRHLEHCSTIVDVGANIGLASWFLARHFPRVEILAIEPDRLVHRTLERNLRRAAGSFRIIRSAIWSDDRGICRANTENRYAPFAFLHARAATFCDRRRTVLPSTTMPQIVEMLSGRPADLLKVDVEGAEIEMFRGDLAWLGEVGCIAIEFHNSSREKIAFDATMRHYGFEIVDESDHTVVALRRGPRLRS